MAEFWVESLEQILWKKIPVKYPWKNSYKESWRSLGRKKRSLTEKYYHIYENLFKVSSRNFFEDFSRNTFKVSFLPSQDYFPKTPSEITLFLFSKTSYKDSFWNFFKDYSWSSFRDSCKIPSKILKQSI